MNKIIAELETAEIARLNKTIPQFAPGDTVVVNVNVVEGERKLIELLFAGKSTTLDSNFGGYGVIVSLLLGARGSF